MHEKTRLLPVTVLLALTQADGALAAEQWFLFGRHGGCSEIASLRRKLPDLPDVRDPQAFLQFLETKRLRFTTQAHAVSSGKVLEVHVPEAELSLLFATEQYCRAASNAK
jgi:hypothetical protein